jgi:gamma-glutamyltranspeptidase/glutathione hydrolase
MKGGNAVDAAVASAFALGVTEPYASGIGGGGFMLIYVAKSKKVVTIDYRETASIRAAPRMYLTEKGGVKWDEVRVGHRAVAVPGTVAGLSLALSKFGKLDLKSVIQPSIPLAEEGFQVNRIFSSMMRSNAQKLLRFSEAARIYLKEGHPYPVGDRIRFKDLGKSYRMVAEKGPDAFFKGEIAQAIEKEMKRQKGLIAKDDLGEYRPILREPVKGTYRGHEIFSMGPPSSGGTHLIQLLNILEDYKVDRLGHNSPEGIERMAKAMRYVFYDRARFMGDPDFVKIPIQGLLSKRYAESLRDKESRKKMEAPDPSRFESDQTTHLSVVDREGNMVALTQTLNSFFGSGVVVPGTGILLNNEMSDFVPRPGLPNSIQPQKRPLSSMSPTLVLRDGKPYLSIGMPGAARIISGLPQILMNLIDHHMNIQEAIDAPRIHCMSGEISMESRIPENVRSALIGKGYPLDVRGDFDLFFGGAQGVLIDPATGVLYGAADPRREGAVMGY